jgi:hypothetical protein
MQVPVKEKMKKTIMAAFEELQGNACKSILTEIYDSRKVL